MQWIKFDNNLLFVMAYKSALKTKFLLELKIIY